LLHSAIARIQVAHTTTESWLFGAKGNIATQCRLLPWLCFATILFRSISKILPFADFSLKIKYDHGMDTNMQHHFMKLAASW